MRSVYKGQFEYINKRKRQLGLICAVCFLLVLAVFLTGYIAVGRRENLMTVAAILGVLPAAKFAATLFMVLPYRSLSKEEYDKAKEAAGDAILYVDMLISTEKKVLPTDAVVIRGGNVCGYTSHPKYDVSFAQTYISDMLKKNGVKANVRIFTDQAKFLRRARELAALGTDEKQREKDDRTAALMLTLIL